MTTAGGRSLSLSSLPALLLLGLAGACAEAPPERPDPPAEPSLPRAQEDPEAALHLYRQKRWAADGKALGTVDRYLQACEAMRRMPAYSSRLGREFPSEAERKAGAELGLKAELATWEPLGPGNIGGRTRALVVDPHDPSTLYAGGVSGGVWKSTNGGRRWRPLADMLPNIAVSTLAMAPDDSSTLYAGTGEGFFRELIRGTALPLRGAGIFRSEDAGESWQRLDATATEDFHWVNDLVVSPADPRRLYAATRSGVWRSLDHGLGWSRVLASEAMGGCLDLELRPGGGGDFLFAACGTFERSRVFRNPAAEGGGAWEQVLSEQGMGRTSLAVAPSDPDVVYALAASYLPGPQGRYEGGLHAFYRSSGAGAAGTWEARVRNDDPDKLATLLLTNPVGASRAVCGFGEDSYSTLGWYTNTVAVDPADPNIVFAGGVDLFRSDDGGRSWGPISYWWSSPPSAHADQHKVVFDPGYDGAANRRMYLAGDGGVWRTDNPRALRATDPLAPCNPASSNVAWTSLNHNLGITQFYHGAPLPDGRGYFGGTQDNGTLLGGDSAGIDGWRSILGGDGGYVAVDPTNPDNLYAESQRLALRRSTDGGASFTRATTGIEEPSDNFLFIVPFVMDPSEPRRLYIGGRSLWRTANGAVSWVRASPQLSAEGKVSAIAVAPSDPDRVLVGLSNGFLHRSAGATASTGAAAWPAARPRAGFVTSLAFDPADPLVAYATYAEFGGRHVYKSEDGGETWTAIDGGGAAGLPDIPVHSLVVDPGDPRRLFLGTDLGVFVSTRGGRRWAVENTGFANAVTESLALLDPPGRRPPTLFAFTHGRGSWRVELAADGGGPAPGPCSLEAGHPRFCDECGPCTAGQGDCDRDSDCASGLTCASNVGAEFGFRPSIDVCVAGGDGGGGGPCSLAVGSGRFCTECGPCTAGQGDCDGDRECSAGLTCASNVGADFGFRPSIDVCVAGGGGGGGPCTVAAGSGRFCTECGPCSAGQGDCDGDAECASGLTCASNVGADFGFSPNVDVCVSGG